MSNGVVQQLGAKGIADVHLSLKAQFSYWKRTYKRPAAFAIETYDVTLPNVTWSPHERSITIPKSGDLLTRVYLRIKVAPARLANPGEDTVHWTNVLGHAGLQQVQFFINTYLIDQVHDDWLEIVHEVSSNSNKNVDELVLRSPSKEQLIEWTTHGNTLDTDASEIAQLTVKMPFWWCDVASQAMPVITLQNADMNMRFRLRSKPDLLIFSNPNNTALDPIYNGEIKEFAVLCNYVIVENIERKLFLTNHHEYLMKNYQYSDFHTKPAGAQRMQANLTFTFPCLYFCFYFRRNSLLAKKDYFNFERTDGKGDDCFLTAYQKLSEIPREKPHGPHFYRIMQTEQYFDRTPTRNLYFYSFAKYPLASTPSGSLNCSRLEGTQWDITLPTKDGNGNVFEECQVKFFAVHWNVIRFSGATCNIRYIT